MSDEDFCLIHGYEFMDKKPFDLVARCSKCEEEREAVQTSDGNPESFGWLRRSEFDQGEAKAYESPDGKLQLFPPGQQPKLVRLQPKD